MKTKKKYQSGGVLGAINPFTLLPLPSDTLGPVQPSATVPNEVIKMDRIHDLRKRLTKADALIKLTSEERQQLTPYSKVGTGKSKSKDRFRELQSGGDLNPLDPNSYGKPTKVTPTLPEFTVVGVRKNSPKRKTLEYIKNAESSMPEINIYDSWVKSGRPSIKEGRSITGREYFNPANNSMHVDFEEDGFGMMSESNKKFILNALDNKIPYASSSQGWGPLDSLFLDNAMIDGAYKFPNLKGLQAELSHAQQQKRDGKVKMIQKFVDDWHHDPFIMGQGQNRHYRDTTTAEYEAHQKLEPQIRSEMRTSPKRHKLDFQSGGNIQKLGDITFGSNGDLVSQLGYRDDSPFNTAPSLNINSSNITMENVSKSLYGISNQTGETKLMKPNKKYKFKDTTSVTEIPAFQNGGFFMDDKKQASYQVTTGRNRPIPFVGRKVNSNYQIPVEEQIDGDFRTPGNGFMTKLNSAYDYVGNDGNYNFYLSDNNPYAYAVNKFDKKVASVDPTKALELRKKYNELNKVAPTKVKAPTTKETQMMLKKAGFDPGPIDGIMGEKTRRALLEYQKSQLSSTYQSGGLLSGLTQAAQGVAPLLGPIGAGLSIASSAIPLVKNLISPREKVIVSASPGNYQTGGDVGLSSGAFQVQGNPNVTDGNTYPHLNAKLDHNEVVSTTTDGNKFVFSADLKDPMTKLSFADLAKPQEKAKGKAEKMLKQYPFDEQAKSTVSLSNANLNNISNTQEMLATRLGLREPDGSTKQSFQSGGKLPYANFDVGAFQNWYNTQPGTKDLSLLKTDNVWGPKTAAAWGDTGGRYPYNYVPEIEEQAAANQAATELANPFPLVQTKQQEYDTRANLINAIPQISTVPNSASNMAVTTPTAPATQTDYKTPWTTGDYFKVAELLGKGIGAFGKAEVEKPLLDRTQLTQETYDPTNALYANQRSYANSLNALSATTPINLRRGIAAGALASKYGADNNVISQYAQMNQNAKTNYQQRASQQAQFNTQAQFRTNEINAANRAAQDSVQQNFFSSLGQFGEDLNRKRYAADVINLYRNQVPDVFDSYTKSLMRRG